jgi:hypothetical protein
MKATHCWPTPGAVSGLTVMPPTMLQMRAEVILERKPSSQLLWSKKVSGFYTNFLDLTIAI